MSIFICLSNTIQCNDTSFVRQLYIVNIYLCRHHSVYKCNVPRSYIEVTWWSSSAADIWFPLTTDHLKSLWVALAGPQQMSCTRAVRITRSWSGTCWPTRQVWWLNCQKKFTPLTFTGSPKPLAERSRIWMRSLSSPALMVSLDIHDIHWILFC